MVTLTGVSKTYSNSVKILDEINLDLRKGDFMYVVGGSGAGKSSLLRLLAPRRKLPLRARFRFLVTIFLR